MKTINLAGERITFIFRELKSPEENNFFKIILTKTITFQGRDCSYLSIPTKELKKHLTKTLKEGKIYEFIPGEDSKVSAEFGALVFEGKNFEIKSLAENESQAKTNEEASTSQQPQASTEQSEPEQIVFTAGRITGHSDSSNTLRIHFAEEIEYQTIKMKGLAILKISLGEN
jgi:hypothetical protein